MPSPLDAEEMRGIIEREDVTVLYQPIFDLRTGEAIGFEAFTRGPFGTGLEQYEDLFRAAASAGLLGKFDELCMRKAIRGATGLLPEQKLFVKRFAILARGQRGRDGSTSESDLFEGEVAPHQIVWEMSEREVTWNFSSPTIEEWTRLGCSLAIDNMGRGFAGLDRLFEYKPQYVKLAMAICRDIHMSAVKREMVDTFKVMAEKVQVEVIATGIEKEDELDVVREIGVDLVQGYLFGEPSRALKIRRR